MNLSKLHTKFLILLIGVALAPVLVVSTVTLIRFQKTLQTEASRLGNQLGATAAAEIQSFVVSQLGVLDHTAVLYKPGFPVEPAVADSILESLLFQNENFVDISVVDTSGVERARKDRVLVIDKSDLRDVSETLAFRAVVADGIYVGPVYSVGGKPFFDIGHDIRDSDGKFAGAVLAQVDAKVMPLVVSTISKIVGENGRVYIVDDRGVVVAYPDISYMLAEKDLSSLPPVRQIIASPEEAETSAIYVNELGLRVLGSAHAMTIEVSQGSGETFRINWFVVAEQPVDVVFDESQRAGLFLAMIAFLTLLGAGAVAFYAAGRVSEPIENLHEATKEFGKGNLAYRARVESKDEIGDLAKSFNVMADTLARSIESLKTEEQIVSAERNKLSVILSGVTNAVIAVDLKGSVILFNRAAEMLLGIAGANVLGTPVGSLMRVFNGDKELAINEYCPLQSGTSEGPVFSKNDLRIVVPKGEERYVNIVSGHISEGLQSNLGCILTLQDITSEYAMERTKREFVSIAAHQLRTPLTGIAWVLESLGTVGVTETARARTIIEGGRGAVRRMISLVDDLLDVSKIEEGQFGIQMKKQSIVPLVMRASETFKDPAHDRKILVGVDVQQPLPEVLIDEEKVEMVLNNVIDNAIKYTPIGGSVNVKAAREGDSVIISVKDSGIGIAKNETGRIFTKFFRSPRALSYFTDGSGLGLYVAKNIIDQHGGNIWFESEEDKGTTFHFSFPVS
ncbi:HAMP domain-containing protein [Candidatus Kaiserbacteria bacterium]|nr:HAMP domain-containing protein [Candidatus Kaiserbacteria bacterium]